MSNTGLNGIRDCEYEMYACIQLWVLLRERNVNKTCSQGWQVSDETVNTTGNTMVFTASVRNTFLTPKAP